MRSYRTKVADPIELLDRDARRERLEAAGYNVFNLAASDVYVDLLTDSGTGAMSAAQWGALMHGDEAYAGSDSFDALEAAVREVMGHEHVVPTHQGRGAENVLYGALLEPGDVAINNTHFDTTRAHVAEQGATAVDCPETPLSAISPAGTFQGNLDVEAARARAAEVGADAVGCIIVTITNNSAAGQPVALENLEAAADLADELDVPFVVDACRFAENALFNVRGGDDEVAAVARSQLHRADAVVMSGKKDALANIGGFVATSDPTLYDRLRPRAILYEGFPTYGGLAGRDLEAMAVGLREAVDRAYLEHRVGQVERLVARLADRGVPVVEPAAGHAAYVDAGAVYDHLSAEAFPGQAFVCALYREGGVRAVELGSFAFPGTDRPEFVRLAVPRRMYHEEHLEHVAAAAEAAVAAADAELGLEIVDEPGPPELRHFSATLRPRSD
ncbi:MAG: tryptophanase [Halobacteriales archaeon]